MILFIPGGKAKTESSNNLPTAFVTGPSPTVILKEPPKQRVNNEPDKVKPPDVTTVNSVNQTPKKSSVPVTVKPQNNNQSVTSKNNEKITPSVTSEPVKGSKVSEISDSSKGDLSSEKSLKDSLNVEKTGEGKEQLSTPKKERYIPPLPRSSSKYVLVLIYTVV